MKITEIIAHPLSTPIQPPRWTAHELMDRAQVTLVEVRTDQGSLGLVKSLVGRDQLSAIW
jgi:hypothetical protein